MSLLNCVPHVPCVPAWSTCSCAKLPKCQTRANVSFFTCQRANKHASVPKVYQLSNLVCQYAKGETIFQLCLSKGVPIFQLFFKIIFQFWIFQLCWTFANFKNIWAIIENLSCETKNLNFDICKISSRKNLVSLTPLTSFSMEHVGLTEQLFG